MKRSIAVFLLCVLMTGTAGNMAGCTAKSVPDTDADVVSLASSDESDMDIPITRAQLIELLANQYQLTSSYSDVPIFPDVALEHPTFTQIQACAEWEMIGIDGDFKPDDIATVGFAVLSAVKGIGLDVIADSVNGALLVSEEDIYSFYERSSGDDLSGSNARQEDLLLSRALGILENANRISSSLELRQAYEITYQDRTITMTAEQIRFSADGETGTFRDVAATVGDIVMVNPHQLLPEGKIARIMSVEGNDFTYENADITDAIVDFSMQGTYSPELISFRPLTDGVELVSDLGIGEFMPMVQSGGAQQMGGDLLHRDSDNVQMLPSANIGDYSITVSHGAASGSVKLSDMKLTVNLPTISVWGFDTGVPDPTGKYMFNLDYTFKTNITLAGEVTESVPLGELRFSAYEVVGLKVGVYLKIGAEGSVSVELSCPMYSSLEAQAFRAPKTNMRAGNPSASFEVEAKAYVRLQPQATLYLLSGIDIGTLGLYSGLEVVGSATGSTQIGNASNDVICMDLKAYVPLAFFAKLEMKAFGVQIIEGVEKKWEVWTASNSVLRRELHIENFQVVPECTQGGQEETDADSDWDEDMAPEPDLDFFDMTAEEAGFLAISAFSTVLDVGETDRLLLLYIPEGYSAGDIIFESASPGIASVDSMGNIQGIMGGSTVIKVSTGDGEHMQYCAVIVLESYHVEFEPLPDT